MIKINKRISARFRTTCIDNYCLNPDSCVVCRKGILMENFTTIIKFRVCNSGCLEKFKEYTTVDGKLLYQSSSSAAGLITGIKFRSASLAEYYNNPSKCKNCESIISVKPGEKLTEVRSRNFCNKSCAAQLNNRLCPKRVHADKQGECINCKSIIFYKRLASGYFSRKKYCETCLLIKQTISVGHLKNELHSSKSFKTSELFLLRTKEELFKNRKNWQSASSAIRKHARRIYAKNNSIRKCSVCSYSNYFEICHIKQVSDFPGSATMGEINKIENLIALCPNHHWDLDHGLLDLAIQMTSPDPKL